MASDPPNDGVAVDSNGTASPPRMVQSVSSLFSRRGATGTRVVRIEPAPFGAFLPFGLMGRVLLDWPQPLATEQEGEMVGQMRRFTGLRLEVLTVQLNSHRDQLQRDRNQDLVRRVTELTRKRHPHLEQLLGTCFLEDHLYVVRLSSKLVPVREYAQENMTFRRDEILLAVARALSFLHARSIVHGDVNAENVFAAANGTFILGGLINLPATEISSSEDSSAVPKWASLRGNELPPWPSINEDDPNDDPNWTPPRDYRDVDDPAQDSMSKEDLAEAREFLRSASLQEDLQSFGFLILSAFTDLSPVPLKSMSRILRSVINHQEPLRPRTAAELHGLDDHMWQIALRCWRLSGPPIDALAVSTLIAARQKTGALLRCPIDWRDEDLKSWAEKQLPTLEISDIRELTDGRDIENTLFEVQGTWSIAKKDTKPVKLIDPRACRQINLWQYPWLLSQAYIWRQLKHSHVLPLLGICRMPSIDSRAFVVPWMAGGSLTDYLLNHPNADRYTITIQVAQALQYLHTRTPPIIHYDVRPHTVFMSEDGTPYLAHFDFGPYYTTEREYTFDGATSMRAAFYRPRDRMVAAPPVDIYEFGMLCYEVFTGLVPFGDLDPGSVYAAVSNNQRPLRPSTPAIPDALWDLITRCWRRDPFRRPTSTTVIRTLEEIKAAAASTPTTTSS